MFIVKLDEAGSALLNSTFLGEGNPDYGGWLALDEEGRVYVAGFTYSREFPVTEDAFDPTYDKKSDIVIARFDANLTTLQYATYLGGEEEETPSKLVVEGPGTILLTGITRSRDAFPTTPGAYETDLNGYWEDIFVLRMDIDPPTVIADGSDRNATTGDPFHVNVTVEDNLRVSSVVAKYWFGTDAAPIGIDCGLVSGTTSKGTWSSKISVPDDSLEDLHYVIEARDSANNTVVTVGSVVDVLDDDPPELLSMDAPSNAPVGERITVTVEVRDNIGMHGVNMTYAHQSEPPWQVRYTLDPVDVDPGGNGTYGVTFTVDPPYIGTCLLIVYTQDVNGNVNMSESWRMDVTDDDPPLFMEDLSPDEATTGDPFNVTFRVRDNVGLAGVWCHYWYGREAEVNSTMEPGVQDMRHQNLTVRHTQQTFHYIVVAMDSSGNVNWSVQVDLEVRDNDPPVLVNDASDPAATTGDRFTIQVEVEDNLGVANVKVIHWFAGLDPRTTDLMALDVSGTGNGTYGSTIAVPNDSDASLHYRLEVTDDNGNVLWTEEREVVVQDDDPPSFGDDLTDEVALRGEMFTFEIEVRDNIDVEELRCEWWFGEGEHINESVPLDSTIAIDVPLDPEGPLRYLFSARDGAGNWNSTHEFERLVPT
jgi:hypothetical protein